MLKSRVAAVAAVAAFLASLASAQPTTIPNGPNGENESLASLRSYAQMLKALESAVQTSNGAATLRYAPYKSNTGRLVPYVVIGNGPTAALIIAQQHGDEMETSDSAVNFVRTLVNNSNASKVIRNSLTVVVVPRVNVDGFDGEMPDGTPLTDTNGNQVPWRQNYDPRFTVNPLPAFYQRGRGYDINRYHAFRPECPLDNPNYPNLTTGVTSCETKDIDSTGPYLVSEGNPVPEAKNVRWINDQFKPVVALDMHHQGDRVHDGRLVTASTLYPTADGTAARLQEVDPTALARFNAGKTMAKRVVVIIAETLAQYPYANLSRYPGGTEPGISRNAYGLLGSGSVLLELRGGIGTKSGGYIQKIGYHASMAIVEQLAKDPTLGGFSPDMADVLVVPANGQPPATGPGEADEDDPDHLGN
ncbi:M14 family zinc carboxypeptidase [Variovorax sp. DT-64]|uniref:M14 family zinc carboxypeptidase n=1 Tax=Variovorax sp. DT-64 TaxID=3396160 RepID=UPI003F1A90E7